MTKIDDYRRKLRSLTDWKPYLLQHSGLPGARGNLELAQAFAEQARSQLVEEFLAIPPRQAPENSASLFLVFCAIAALGKGAARGDRRHFARLRTFASDPRWRVREAVAIALQNAGDGNMQTLLTEMRRWRTGGWYEKRAAAPGLAGRGYHRGSSPRACTP